MCRNCRRGRVNRCSARRSAASPGRECHAGGGGKHRCGDPDGSQQAPPHQPFSFSFGLSKLNTGSAKGGASVQTGPRRDWHKGVTIRAALVYRHERCSSSPPPNSSSPPSQGVETLCCGIGPVEAAAATARALALRSPRDALLHVGIAGARDLEPGSLVIGTEAVYCDLDDPASAPREDRARRLPTRASSQPPALRFPPPPSLPIATSARVGRGAPCADVEAMEGFGVLRAAAAAGVPALELRAVSNAFDARTRRLAHRRGAVERSARAVADA